MPFERLKSSGYMTNWAARLFTRAMDQHLAPLGLSSAYMPVLFALAGGARLSQTALAAQASVEQPTMAATLKRMERDGLIAREPDPKDGRSALVSLSPLGLGKLPQVYAAGRAINAQAMAPLTEPEQAQYLDLLRRVVGALEGDR